MTGMPWQFTEMKNIGHLPWEETVGSTYAPHCALLYLVVLVRRSTAICARESVVGDFLGLPTGRFGRAV